MNKTIAIATAIGFGVAFAVSFVFSLMVDPYSETAAIGAGLVALISGPWAAAYYVYGQKKAA